MKQMLITLVLALAIVEIRGCKYFCRDEDSYEYKCCDDQGPGIGKDTASASDDANTQYEQNTSRCRYYCAYKRAYCCDDGTLPLPADHDLHEGRCVTESEQVCKKGTVVLSYKALKASTRFGSREVGGDNSTKCASDGYCREDEKCCINTCAGRHTCMKAIYDGAKKDKVSSHVVNKN